MANLRDLLFKSDREDVPNVPIATPLAHSAAAAERAWVRYMRRRRQKLEQQVGPKGCEAVHLLPFLLHVNQPDVPGFVAADGCPLGITSYSPGNLVLALARKLFPKARIRRSGVLNPAVDLVAVMGSAGTIGFTSDSDLDVWVCHNRAIGGGASLRRYREKVQAVEQWLTEYSGLEIHLFLQATGRIRDNDFGETDVEGCGSAMGALLKEEFYRTAVHLAGKNPFWWLVPPGSGPDGYQDYLELLHQDPTFATDEYVDLGWVAQVPLGELFGAAVWQIAKGWKSPFKSALKMGMLEKAVHAENSRPLCEIIKERVCQGETPDPYRVLFDEVLAHYRGMRDTATEDLLARCFYLKTAVRLDPALLQPATQQDPDAAVLAGYVQDWGWGPRRIRHLNEFEQWRFEWLRGLAQEVDRFFLRTYKRIRAALDQCGESQRITPRDLTILGRKLQTVYRRAPNKVETVHLISHGTAEPILSLYQEPLPDGECPWCMYRGRVTPLNVEQQEGELLRSSPDVLELLVWACHNGLLGPRSRLLCHSIDQRVTAATLENLAQEILTFGADAQRLEPPLADLLEAPRPTHLLVIPNLGLAGESVQQISAAYSTSWGEGFYQRWIGPGAFSRCTEEVLFPFIQDSPAPQEIRVFAPQQKVGGRHDAARRLYQEIPALVAQLMTVEEEPQLVKRRYVGSDEGGYFVCDRPGQEDIRYRSFPDDDALVRYLSGVGPYQRVDTRIEDTGGALSMLKAVYDTAVPGMIDVFWLEQSDQDILYVVDEIGNLTHFNHRPDNEPYALAKLLVFLETTLPEVAGHPENPLRAPILGEVIRLHSVLSDGTCRVRTATHELLGRVHALGLEPVGLTIEKTGGGRKPSGHRITWGDQVFDSGAGGNPLEEVRHRIAETRNSGLDYEVFLTRLFLDDRFLKQYCGSFPTTGHYLFYKKLIEQRLSVPTGVAPG